MKKSDYLYFELSKHTVIALFFYYFILLLTGLALSIYVMCNLPIDASKTEVIIKTVLASLSVSCMFCCLQYIKRLYKACITYRIIENAPFWGRLGNIVYFFLRPFYSFVFVIVMIFALLSGMFVVIGNLDDIVNEKLLYLCVILSSFIGYSVGHVLDKFEKTSQDKIDNFKMEIKNEP